MIICHLDKLIKESGLRPGFIAEKMEVSTQQLSNWRHGRSFPSTPKLYKLAYLLGCTANDMYEYVEEEIEKESSIT
ncbi:transcriptional regulator with XRE-family HTH domain [Evansella vedderi]|uniref:Transcriptional regulator with XRE-family HTH domain n=1 Tax=Evansella vedderi TaxID=38282 RepID=A0ABT9ZUN0_9BACI|nr:helix-turn-helix transcriptional regulator [Evansella vedderi]MDQ0254942.1 transcriptional regulator with XRE-family HTH domain [Evansella vedderi]